jgi:hypothetical protein
VVHAKHLLEAAPEYDVPSTSHLITEMCRSVGLSESVDIRPYFYLSDAERAGESLSQRQAVTQCADPASASHAPLKHWRREGNQVLWICSETNWTLFRLAPQLTHCWMERSILGERPRSGSRLRFLQTADSNLTDTTHLASVLSMLASLWLPEGARVHVAYPAR